MFFQRTLGGAWMNERTDRAFWTKEVAETLGIGASTLRKWCLALEETGYTFTKGAKNSRAFIEDDIIILRRMKDLIHKGGMNVQGAIKIALADDFDNEKIESVLEDNVTRTPSVHQVNTSVLPEEIALKFLEQQEQVLERLERLEQIEKANKEHLHRIEQKIDSRDDQFVQAYREIQESKKLLATSQEKAPEKKWWEFWKTH